MIVEVNGIKYQSVDEPKRRPLSKIAMVAIMMGAMYGIGSSKPVSSKLSMSDGFDFVKEYGLIKNKESKLTKSQRDYVIWYFEKHFKLKSLKNSKAMINLKQLTEDSFSSAFRRFPNSTSDDVIQKIYEELSELEDAIVSNINGGMIDQSSHCPELTAVEEELADVILACLVFANLENIDIDKALRIKNEFNKTRP